MILCALSSVVSLDFARQTHVVPENKCTLSLWTRIRAVVEWRGVRAGDKQKGQGTFFRLAHQLTC
jgi:hypothetical protein